jgi:HlyD family secretion protein
MAETEPSLSDLSRLRIARKPARLARKSPLSTWSVRLLVLGAVVAGAWFGLPPLLRNLGVIGAPALTGLQFGTAQRVNPVAEVDNATASGYVSARTRCSVASPIQGKLIKLNVDTGMKVKEGDVLAEIEHEELDALLGRAQADEQRMRSQVEVEKSSRVQTQKALQSAEAGAEEARLAVTEGRVIVADTERTLLREQELLRTGIGSQESTDKAQTTRDVAKARLDTILARERTARAEVERLKAELGMMDDRIRAAEHNVGPMTETIRQAEAARRLAIIRAPFSGVILRKDAEVGEVVSPVAFGGSGSRTAIVTMADFETLEFEVDLSEHQFRKIEEGDPCRVVLDALPEVPLLGHVRRIEPTANRDKASVQIKIALDTRHPKVRPELGGRAVFLKPGAQSRAQEADRILVPAAAVVEHGGRRGVFLVESNVVRFMPLELGAAEGDQVRVAGGLRGGERIVLRPPADLADGARVAN